LVKILTSDDRVYMRSDEISVQVASAYTITLQPSLSPNTVGISNAIFTNFLLRPSDHIRRFKPGKRYSSFYRLVQARIADRVSCQTDHQIDRKCSPSEILECENESRPD
jgi:hypothetical protein